MEKTQYLYGFLLLFVSLFACRQDSRARFCLEEAERLMESRPDSSLSLLESVRSPEKLPSEDYATWCLLLTQARDKNYLEHTSDSVIDVAVRYFEQQNEPHRMAQALYCKGRVWQDQGKQEEAAELFVKALDAGKDCSDYHLLFLISSWLGTLYGYQNMAEPAFNSYQKACQYAIQSGDSSCLSYAYAYMGRAYSLSEEWEQSLDHYEKALAVATRINDTQAMDLAMNEYLAVCVNVDRYDKIADYADVLLKTKQEGEDKTGNLERFYLTIGNLYRHLERYDEALLYLSKSLQSENLYTLAGASQSLYFLYGELKQYEKAVPHINKYLVYTDSIQKIENHKAVMEIEAKYNHEKLQKENLQLKLKKRYWVDGSIIGLVVVAILILEIVKRFRRKVILISKLKIQVKDLQQELKKNLNKQDENRSEITLLSVRLETSQKESEKLQKEIERLEEFGEEYKKEIKNLSVQLTEHAARANQMAEIRSQLIQENKKLEKKSLDFEQTIHLLQENIFKLSMDKAPVSSHAVSFALLDKIKKELSPLQEDEWNELFLITDLLHERIMERLSAAFPQLKPEDLKLCCLTKLMFTNEEIASILDIQVDTLAKRKRRLSLKFGKEKWDKGGFNAYIEAF